MIRNWITLADAERATGIPRATWRRWCESGDINGRGWRARQRQKGTRAVWEIMPDGETPSDCLYIEEWKQAQASSYLTGRHIGANGVRANEYGLRKFFDLTNGAAVTAENLRLALSRIPIDHKARRCHYTVRDQVYKGVRSYMRFLAQRGLLDDAERLKTADLKPRRIYEAQRPAPEMGDVVEVLAALSKPSAGRVAYDRALTQTAIATLAFAGLRRAELLALEISDVDLTRAVITVQDGKGHKRRQVGIESRLKDQLRYWLSVRAGKNCRLLTMASGEALTESSLATRLKRLEKKTGIKLSPHALRRAFITHNLGSGVPLVVVQKLAGHADAKTTQIYDRTTADAAMDWLRKR